MQTHNTRYTDPIMPTNSSGEAPLIIKAVFVAVLFATIVAVVCTAGAYALDYALADITETTVPSK